VDRQIFFEQLPIERKVFSFDLRENPRGRFLRITEEVGGRRDAIVIPASGLEALRELFGRILDAHRAAPPAPPAREEAAQP